MDYLQELVIQCPYCGEAITVVADVSDADQSYIEDCEVCCRPITLRLSISDSKELSVQAGGENDA